ncbi:MAG: hypothetical protein MJ133_08650 [Lachnospiraceae bacterium]|nr:hypothetical protein [Lachnospiraceae bacterium]
MGTSASSNGPGSGVSFDPPWLDDVEVPNQQKNDKSNEQPVLAPRARFGNARRNMGEYVRSGDRDSARRALGHYSKTGMGGAQNVAKRMRTSTKVATTFFNTFRSLREDDSFALGKKLKELQSQGAGANQIIDAIVGHVCPVGGSIDETSCRDSGTAAISEFLVENPDADVCNLDDDQIWSLTATYLGNEVFGRVQMDIGQAFEKQEVSIEDRVIRLNDMREYIQSEIAIQMNKLRENAGKKLDINKLLSDTIRNTFEVYEVDV